MGGDSTPSRGVVQSAGKGYRLAAQPMKNEFNKAGPVLHLLLRYTKALITQMSQTAVCNRHHSLDQQLCRWQKSSRHTQSSTKTPYVRYRTDAAFWQVLPSAWTLQMSNCVNSVADRSLRLSRISPMVGKPQKVNLCRFTRAIARSKLNYLNRSPFK